MVKESNKNKLPIIKKPKKDMDKRGKILSDIKKSKKDIGLKKKQIVATRVRSRFQGVRIQDQFAVGIRGIKPFREEGRARRSMALKDLGILGGDLKILNKDLLDKKKNLLDFDNDGLI